ncbi:hypothetical protein [Pseudomonas wenzhouensis]|uniref:YkvI family membrane protein n=1 Tax=Pseudomonas wenzhouensis TaxID=2906062 RepID=UPI001E2E6659|nr:hypothetical protein [Pseudomonas wenzhouensis]UFQ97929.1 hypothetical protein J7655_01530 [Pseudomonas wenzhouensis]
MNKQSIQIALAYMSVVIGGGFASGNEILQFFTRFGLIGVAGTLVSALLFAFLGMQIARMSSQMQATSHKEVLYKLFGKTIGFGLDVVLSFFLYGVGVVMLAAAGSTLFQQFGLPPLLGGSLLAVLAIATLCLNVRGIINLISVVMPFLLGMVLLITIYSIFSYNAPLDVLNAVAQENSNRAADNWIVSALLYASFNIAVGLPMLVVIGGLTRDHRAAGLGGVVGGLGLGFLILVLNIGLFANINQLQNVELPTLALAANIHPALAVAMSLSLICMIYSTGVGMFFAFSARFSKPETTRFKWVSAVSVAIGLALSQFGFTKLVGTVYPLLGYVGFALILAIGFSWMRRRSAVKAQKAELKTYP